MPKPTPPTIGRESAKARALAVPDVPSLTAAADASKASVNGPMNDGTGADGEGPDHTFTLDYTDERGRRWVGEFVCKVLSIKDSIQLGLIKSRLAGGVPVSHLDSDTAYLLEVLAHLTVALVQRPVWANDLMSLYETGVVGAIYAEVASKEARFRKAERPAAR